MLIGFPCGSESKHMDDADAFRRLQRNLRSLRQQQRHLVAEQARSTKTPMRRVLVCTLIACLCGDDGLAQMWTHMDQQRRGRSTRGQYAPVTQANVAGWRLQHATHATIVQAQLQLTHPLRREADDFLLEGLVLEAIKRQCQKGLAVPTSWIVDTYIRLWRHRPRSAATDEILRRLETEDEYKKNGRGGSEEGRD